MDREQSAQERDLRKMDDLMIPNVHRNRRKSSGHYGNISCTNLFQSPSIKEFIVLSGSASKPEHISRNSV